MKLLLQKVRPKIIPLSVFEMLHQRTFALRYDVCHLLPAGIHDFIGYGFCRYMSVRCKPEVLVVWGGEHQGYCGQGLSTQMHAAELIEEER